MPPRSTSSLPPVDWVTSPGLVGYEEACAVMAVRVDAIASGEAPELVWLLEHPPLYTAGTSARPNDLLQPERFPVHRSGRGGQYTYHGPGQRIAYVLIDVGRRFGDVRAYVAALEAWIIATLEPWGVNAATIPGRVGVWVPQAGCTLGDTSGSDKIAAIGVRLRRWVSSHGIAINVAPDLSHFAGIVPCGIPDGGVTSLAKLKVDVGIEQLDASLRAAFEARFGATQGATLGPLATDAGSPNKNAPSSPLTGRSAHSIS